MKGVRGVLAANKGVDGDWKDGVNGRGHGDKRILFDVVKSNALPTYQPLIEGLFLFDNTEPISLVSSNLIQSMIHP